ncbi:H+/gluconate symporter [Alkalibacterium putridalgicola]|uniref:Citrate transporter n=1 Tax=Alkalibacterium putridalgicola TaxID=426703 RepID=A0A1H7UR06_9LACT|nr:GntP family permease [Alkalibacterium putridalgicola]GEK88529.1 citrate transporter [Alkalibacterium putridalgicola]SEL98847.1 H+/gluconate symporter [Alkalibacterium putridalgicola]
MEVLGIIIGLFILMGLAYMGYSIIWVAPLAAGFVAWTGGLNLLEAYTGVYMTGLVGFLQTWFPVFMLSSIFGKLMEDTGMARSVALTLSKVLGEKRAILGVFLSAAVLTYGGISLFVVVFAVYPLALSLFREANLPRRLIPATIALGAFTFTMTALPGTPQIQNLIPIPYFFTSPTAAPIMGIAAALVMAIGGYLYLVWRQNQLVNKGELFDEPKDNTVVEVTDGAPNVFLSLIPLLSVLITLNLLEWNIIVSLMAGIILILLLSLPRIRHIGVTSSINGGAKGSVTAILNTSAAVGFGTTVQAVPGFAVLTSALMSIPGNPLVSLSVAINLLAGATGSASGGMGIALAALGEQYYELSQTSGISPEAFHRVASISSGGLDVLPHNGAVLTLLTITGLTHKDSYMDIAVVAIIIPVASVIVAIILASLGLY